MSLGSVRPSLDVDRYGLDGAVAFLRGHVFGGGRGHQSLKPAMWWMSVGMASLLLTCGNAIWPVLRLCSTTIAHWRARTGVPLAVRGELVFPNRNSRQPLRSSATMAPFRIEALCRASTRHNGNDC